MFNIGIQCRYIIMTSIDFSGLPNLTIASIFWKILSFLLLEHLRACCFRIESTNSDILRVQDLMLDTMEERTQTLYWFYTVHRIRGFLDYPDVLLEILDLYRISFPSVPFPKFILQFLWHIFLLDLSSTVDRIFCCRDPRYTSLHSLLDSLW